MHGTMRTRRSPRTRRLLPGSFVLLTLGLLPAGCGRTEAPSSIPFSRPDARIDSTFAALGERFPGYFHSLISADMDEHGHLYVLDQGEGHIVVLDEELNPLRVIGRRGQGPGELRISSLAGPGAHSLAVGGGLLAVVTDNTVLELFQAEGTFLRRITLNPLATDVAIAPDGTIVCYLWSGRESLAEYSPEGELLRRYGTPTLPIHLEAGPGVDRTLFSFFLLNPGDVEVLDDGTVVTLARQWPILKRYRDGHLISEVWIDLEGLKSVLPAGPDRESIEFVISCTRTITPEQIAARYRAGTLNPVSDAPGASPQWRLASRGQEVWFVLGHYLSQVDEEGSIVRVVRTPDLFSASVAMKEDRVVVVPILQEKIISIHMEEVR